MHIALLGTFDVENYGDLLFPLVLERRLADHVPAVRVTQVSPRGSSQGVWSEGRPVLSFEEFLARAEEFDGIVVGGGNIVHLEPSLLAAYDDGVRIPVLGYARLWIGAAVVAWQRGIPLVWNAPGVPAEIPEGCADLARWAVEQADHLAVRDRASGGFLAALGRAGRPVEPRVVVDPALDLDRLWRAEDLERTAAELLERGGLDRGARTVAFHLNGRYARLDRRELAAHVETIAGELGGLPVLIAIGPCHGDGELLREVSSHLSGPHLGLGSPASLRDVAALVAHSQAYVGSSLHGMVTAVSLGRPGLVVAPSSRPKFDGFLEQVGIHDGRVEDWASASERVRAGRGPVAAGSTELAAARGALDGHLRDMLSALGAPARRSRDAGGEGPPVGTAADGLPVDADLMLHGTEALLQRARSLEKTVRVREGDLRAHRERLLGAREELARLRRGVGEAEERARAAEERARALEADLQRRRVDEELGALDQARAELEQEQVRLLDTLQSLREATERLVGSSAWTRGRALHALLRRPRQGELQDPSERLLRRLAKGVAWHPEDLPAIASGDGSAARKARAARAREGLRKLREHLGELGAILRLAVDELEQLTHSRPFVAGRVLDLLPPRRDPDAGRRARWLCEELRLAGTNAPVVVPVDPAPTATARPASRTGSAGADARAEQLARIAELSLEHLRLVAGSRKWRLADGLARRWRALRSRVPGPDLEAEVQRLERGLERLAGPGNERVVTLRPAGAPRSDPGAARRSSVADIVVCIHNAPEDVQRCIDAIARHTNLRHHNLILVDDGSDPETQRLVVQAVTRLGARYVRHEQARGYTVAANRGIEKATGDHVVLLNSDTVVSAGWIDRLVECAEEPAVGHSRPVGCVGPLSNAASWQSIPRTHDEHGWVVNELPPGRTVEDVAREVARSSPRLYPEVPLVNGFCYLIRREALDAAGLLDEENFPRGYGEEDDFSIRLLDLGFRHRIADDCYVWHAKSKSFTSEGRARLVEKAKAIRAEKHGVARIKELSRELAGSEDLLRARTVASLAATEAPFAGRGDLGEGRSVGWIMPHLKAVGGVRRTIEMSSRLQAWGFDVTIYTPTGEKEDWLPIAARVTTFEELAAREHDILIATDPDVIEPFLAAEARLPVLYHLAAYHLYREPGPELERYYSVGDGVLHLANSNWTRDQIRGYCEVEHIIPGGIARHLFRPVRTARAADVVCYGSRRPHKGTALIREAAQGLELLELASLGAPQEELARHISSGEVFVSACKAEGFNFCALEAMACGVPVVLTDDGGSREYARHGESALVVPEWGDPRALREAIDRLRQDRPLRLRLIEEGLRTAWGFTWDRVTSDLASALLAGLRQRV